MRDKTGIDRTVAALLGVRERDVSRITEAFLAEARRRIVEEGEVRLDGFGRFRLQCVKFNAQKVTLTKGAFRKGVRLTKNTTVVYRKYWVHFAKSETFRRIIREKTSRGETP